ncbi:MAG TPA: flagellar hook-basal body complex protein [Candidatus Baltobacteraceae bacterium]|nr:flagellar hook-basal body complex protein [Candidatus Baltobacteraceae bacterium]
MAYDALYTGISGLNAYQSQIDLISNNIANAGTTGFKAQRMTFVDAFYQTQQASTAPNNSNGGTNAQQVGVGVRIGSVDTNFQQGGLQTTGINTDLAINGDGFFILNNTAGTGTPVYTRNGAFSINTQGTLYDPSTGLAVQGWEADTTGNINSTGSPGIITLPIGLAEQAVATGGIGATKLGPNNDKNFDMQIGGSLDQAQYTAEATNPGTGQNKVLTTTIYDSLGNAHDATITFSPIAPNTPVSAGPPPVTGGPLPSTVNDVNGNAQNVGTRWGYSISFADGTVPSNSNGYVFFDTNGQYINSSSSTTGTPVHTVGNAPAVADGNLLTIPVSAAGPPATGWPTGDSASAAAVGLDFSSMSSLSGSSTANVIAQNGFPPGVLSNVTVGQDGTVTGSYTNGNLKTLAKVALATFQNEDGLQRVAGGFKQTSNSGLAQIGVGDKGRFGAVIGGSLEQSNVSLADEFTKLITAQRAFEANSRGISTADQNLLDVVNMHASEN